IVSAFVSRANVAVIAALALPTVSSQTAAVMQAPASGPLQPVKVEWAAGVAVSLTALASTKECAQAPPQLIPAGALLMVPVPVPPLVTVRLWVVGVKEAETLAAASIWTSHSVALGWASQPLHATSWWAAGTAVRVTVVPSSNSALQGLVASVQAEIP